jgi:hypothetical protein
MKIHRKNFFQRASFNVADDRFDSFCGTTPASTPFSDNDL